MLYPTDHIIIGGDFNAKHTTCNYTTNSPRGNDLQATMEAYGFCLQNNFATPTRIGLHSRIRSLYEKPTSDVAQWFPAGIPAQKLLTLHIVFPYATERAPRENTHRWDKKLANPLHVLFAFAPVRATAPSAGLVKIIQLPACIRYVLAVFLMAAASSSSWSVPVYDPVAEDVACVPSCVVHVHVMQSIKTSASSEAAAISGTLRQAFVVPFSLSYPNLAPIQRFPDNGRPIYNQGMDGVAIVITGFDSKTELVSTASKVTVSNS
ncbi:hypothetical protein HPB48_024007 [Haemaphysalis longicornis]|uniref:Endonuclease/exonuclease/phosphatase domain-containing protein n=1 Tax=Haemaphysalis longicornis TaxID=44386 RepID=A0A9J6H8W3_HAELO|nr:hypothetical protein HPB48_024007 [Haemaphysalis longicornis]